ncbi:hypothetical protein PCE1_002923 [Barthelona sp. PCE]
MSNQQVLTQFGVKQHWGITPPKLLAGEEILNALSVNSSDFRHELHTLYHNRGINELDICIVELDEMILTRQMIFWSILLDRTLSAEDRVRILLPFYGNFLIQKDTHKAIEAYALAVSDSSSLPSYMRTKHRFKDNDRITACCNAIRSGVYDHNVWDERLRRKWRDRYGARNNLFDWAYDMDMKCFPMKRLRRDHYRLWRGTGIAFSDVSGSFAHQLGKENVVVNPSLITHEEYDGDFVISPYVGLGTVVENEEYTLTRQDGEFIHSERLVILDNLTRYITRLDEIPFENISLTFSLGMTRIKKFKNRRNIFVGVFASAHIEKIASNLAPDGNMYVENGELLFGLDEEIKTQFVEQVNDLLGNIYDLEYIQHAVVVRNKQ